MELNVELLDKTLAYIEAHPEEHDQSRWMCGTKMCFAGHALVQAGNKLEEVEGEFGDSMPTLNGKRIYWSEIPEIAEKKLGLSWNEANRLFYDAESLDEVRETVARIKANHNIT